VENLRLEVSGFPQELKTTMSKPNGLLSQKLCHYLKQGHTFL